MGDGRMLRDEKEILQLKLSASEQAKLDVRKIAGL